MSKILVDGLGRKGWQEGKRPTGERWLETVRTIVKEIRRKEGLVEVGKCQKSLLNENGNTRESNQSATMVDLSRYRSDRSQYVGSDNHWQLHICSLLLPLLNHHLTSARGALDKRFNSEKKTRLLRSH